MTEEDAYIVVKGIIVTIIDPCNASREHYMGATRYQRWLFSFRMLLEGVVPLIQREFFVSITARRRSLSFIIGKHSEP